MSPSIPTEKGKEKATPSQKVPSGKRVAVILVRGLVGVRHDQRDTLLLLRLRRKNICVVLENNPVMLGMIQKVKDFVTWGELQEEVFQELLDRRGEAFQGRVTDSKEKYTYTLLEVGKKKYKPYFRLNPPRKGFGRKGIKVSFQAGGALGYRGEKINDLVKRML